MPAFRFATNALYPALLVIGMLAVVKYEVAHFTIAIRGR
jgi:hypothetical protein